MSVKWRKRVAVLGLLVCITCFIFATLLVLAFTTSPSKKVLCNQLGNFVDFATCYDVQREQGVLALLRMAFEPGVTTRQQVESALGQYRHDTYESIIGPHDYYALSESWVERNNWFSNEYYLFEFDTENILVSITEVE